MPQHSLSDGYIIQFVKDHTRIKKRTGCWIFTGPRGGTSPYPTLMIDREEYLLVGLILKAVGRIRKPLKGRELEHCHTCDNGRCVNPDHIFIGTQKENVHDAINKGRHNSNRIKEREHCVNGHPFNKANTWLYRDTRWCRTCVRERIRRKKGTLLSRCREPYVERRHRLTGIDLRKMEKRFGNKDRAAKYLKISLWSFYRLWREAGLPLDPTKQNRGRFAK